VPSEPSSIPFMVRPGDRRMAVPVRADLPWATALTTSMAKRARFAMEPPYSSLRALALGAKNCWMR